MMKQFIKVVITTALLSATVIAMAKGYTQVQDAQYFIETIPLLPNIRETSGNIPTKKSPLKAVLYGQQIGNNIALQLNIENQNNNQWFYKKHEEKYFVFIDDKGNALNWYPQSTPEGPLEPINVRLDEEYVLIEPHETREFNFNIPMSYFFTHYKNKVIYINYIDANLPPSLEASLDASNELNIVVLSSNQIKVRCYNYNESQDKYYCDVETLPNLPVFK